MNKVLRRAFLAVLIALPVLVALTVGVAAVNRFAGPRPPRTFSMSTGREGGAYHQFALEYRRLPGAPGIHAGDRARTRLGRNGTPASAWRGHGGLRAGRHGRRLGCRAARLPGQRL